jgi:hypothetical protein
MLVDIMMSSLNNFPFYIIPLIASVVKGKKQIFEKIAFFFFPALNTAFRLTKGARGGTIY